MKCLSFKALARGSLQGFCDIAMDSGLILLGCTYHSSNGKRWVNPPGRPMLGADKKLVLDAGKIAYGPVVEFTDKKVRYKWSAQAVVAIDQFLDGKAPTEAAGAMSRKDANQRDGNPPKVASE